MKDVLIFILIGIPLAVVLWGFSFVVEGVDQGLKTRGTRRRLLRWQKTFFRGKYVIGGSPSKSENEPPFTFFQVFRGFIIFCLIIWGTGIVMSLL